MILLYGRERFLKDEAISEIKKELSANGPLSATDLQQFDAENDAAAAVANFLATPPFLSPKRLAIFWNIDALSADDKEWFLERVGNLPKHSELVMETSSTNIKKDPFLNDLSSKARVIACHTPFERDLPGWIEARAKKCGVGLDRAACTELAQNAPSDLGQLDERIRMLGLYAHPRKTIQAQDVRALFQKAPEQDVFGLADLVLDGRKKEALAGADDLFRKGVRGPEMVASLAGQLEKYRKAKAARLFGKTPSEVGEELRVPRMFQGPFFARLDKLTPEKISRLTKALASCDEAFKSGQLDERLSLERFILTT